MEPEKEEDLRRLLSLVVVVPLWKCCPLKVHPSLHFLFPHVRVWWWSRSYDGAAGSGGQHPAGGSCSAGCLEAGHHHPRPARVCTFSECTFTSPIRDGEDDPLSCRMLFVYYCYWTICFFYYSQRCQVKIRCSNATKYHKLEPQNDQSFDSVPLWHQSWERTFQHHFSEPLRACWNNWNQTTCYLWKLWWESASVTHWPSQPCPNSEICFL